MNELNQEFLRMDFWCAEIKKDLVKLEKRAKAKIARAKKMEEEYNDADNEDSDSEEAGESDTD